MFQNKWVSSNTVLPIPGMVVDAHVRGLGQHKMILVLDQKMKRECAFTPGMWRDTTNIYCWQQADGDFMCKLDMIKSWKHDPQNTKLHNIR